MVKPHLQRGEMELNSAQRNLLSLFLHYSNKPEHRAELVRIQLCLSQQLPTLAPGNSCNSFINLLRKAIIPRIKILLLYTEKTTWAAAVCWAQIPELPWDASGDAPRAFVSWQSKLQLQRTERAAVWEQQPSQVIQDHLPCLRLPAEHCCSCRNPQQHSRDWPWQNTVHKQALPTAHCMEHKREEHTSCRAVTVMRLLN